MQKDIHETWQWQEPGSAWKGVGLYHITLTVTDRRPILGSLVIPDTDPAKAHIVRTALGDALIDTLMNIPHHHPEAQVLHFCLMPDHLHAVLYVRHTMPKGIGTLVRGFWQGAKKLGRACSASSWEKLPPSSFITPNSIREKLKEESHQLQETAATLRSDMGVDHYYQLPPIFTEMPFLRSMTRYSQLPTTIRYLDMNPQRLATKRLMPGFFRVQKGIEICGRSYDGVGNVALLMAERFATVHVRRLMVEQALHGDNTPLRNYKNNCVLRARKGEVMVSPFISPDEKQVMKVLMQEHHPFILLTDNGFHDYYKPADTIFEACAEGRLLILSPWDHDKDKRHISRADCVALNAMAEDICHELNKLK